MSRHHFVFQNFRFKIHLGRYHFVFQNFRFSMSRHHFAVGLAVICWGCAWMIGSVGLAVIVGVWLIVTVAMGVTFPQLKFFGPYVCQGSTRGKRVALTFDDGPDPRSTPALLDVLREARVEAVFFCVGAKVAAHPELAVQIVKEGHLVQNHSYAHSNATNFFTTARLTNELAQAQTEIERVTGERPRLFRPPMGLTNPRTFQAARALDLQVIGWTARGLDTKLTEPNRIVARLERGFKPGAILLLHDGNIPAERLVATVKKLWTS